jgi:hypothetical protein
MIDTIILTLPFYRIVDGSKFTPSTQNISTDRFGSQPWIKYVQNPTADDLRNKNYKPRLTITKRIVKGGIVAPLKVEFSVPKLIFGNNFDEVQEADFEDVLTTLLSKLEEMGIQSSQDNLVAAKVQAVHFSKNVAFEDGTTASSIIRELEKIDLTKKWDLNHRHFQDDGHALYCYAKTNSVVFYDKIKDLKTPSGRAVEKDNALQLNLFEDLNKKPLEILRMEVRLCNAQKIKSIFARLGVPQDFTFKAVFKQETAEKVLNMYWQDIMANLSFVGLASQEPIDLLEAIVKNNQRSQPKTALSQFGALTLIDRVGSRRLRQFINEKYTDKAWQRLKKGLKELDLTPVSKYRPFQAISRALREFKPLKLADFDIDSRTRYDNK